MGSITEEDVIEAENKYDAAAEARAQEELDYAYASIEEEEQALARAGSNFSC